MGFCGLLTTINLVLGVIAFLIASTSNAKPSSGPNHLIGTKTGLAPKNLATSGYAGYEGSGTIISSPGDRYVEIARNIAPLAPGVTITSEGLTPAPYLSFR